MSTPSGGDVADRRTASDFAAGALLGALLLDPQRLNDVAAWLQPDDFSHWADRAVYATLVGLRGEGRDIDVLTVAQAVSSGEYHDAHVDSSGIGPLSWSSLHTLIHSTPATPHADAEGYDEPVRSEHVGYAKLVLDESIRRQVKAVGTRIDQYADHISTQDSVSAVEGLTPVLAEVGHQLRDLAARLVRTDPIRAAMEPTDPAYTAPGTQTAEAPSADRTRVPPTAEELQHAEFTLIGACVASPAVRKLVEDQGLQPDDFKAREVRATWHAINTLQRRGEPVDYVFVGAEIERQGKLPDLGRGLSPTRLARLAERFDRVEAHRAVEIIAHRSLTRAIRQARDLLQDLASDRTQPSEDLLHSAQQTIGGVEITAQRLTGTSPLRARAALTPPAGRNPTASAPARMVGGEGIVIRGESPIARGLGGRDEQSPSRDPHQRRR